jgi:hypothetical protein
MINHPTDTACTNDGEPSAAPERIPTEWVSPVSLLSNPLNSEMSLPVLAALCVRELNTYRRGEPCADAYGVELIRRATVQGEQGAWAWVKYCFGGVVLDWLRRHPKRAHACRLESEEHYVAQAFERFWHATPSHKQVEFTTLAAVLHSLRASLNGAILDMLRADARPRESSRPVPAEPGETHMEDMTSSSEVWEMLKALLVNPREQRLAYLLFHCGLSPREIVRCCPQEWSDVHEVSHLRCTIMERLLCHADQLGPVTHICDPNWGSMVL